MYICIPYAYHTIPYTYACHMYIHEYPYLFRILSLQSLVGLVDKFPHPERCSWGSRDRRRPRCSGGGRCEDPLTMPPSVAVPPDQKPLEPGPREGTSFFKIGSKSAYIFDVKIHCDCFVLFNWNGWHSEKLFIFIHHKRLNAGSATAPIWVQQTKNKQFLVRLHLIFVLLN